MKTEELVISQYQDEIDRISAVIEFYQNRLEMLKSRTKRHK